VDVHVAVSASPPRTCAPLVKSCWYRISSKN
jgi:hypothetical protein